MNLSVNNQLNSSLRHIIVTKDSVNHQSRISKMCRLQSLWFDLLNINIGSNLSFQYKDTTSKSWATMVAVLFKSKSMEKNIKMNPSYVASTKFSYHNYWVRKSKLYNSIDGSKCEILGQIFFPLKNIPFWFYIFWHHFQLRISILGFLWRFFFWFLSYQKSFLRSKHTKRNLDNFKNWRMTDLPLPTKLQVWPR